MRADETARRRPPNVIGYRKLGRLVAATPVVRELAQPPG